MSVKERKLLKLDQKIVALAAKEKSAQTGFPRHLARANTWAHRLFYEFLKNDVAIRAESLSYFTLFSILPLITGIFLFLSLFAEWAPMQKQFDGLLRRFLDAFPEDQRAQLMDFISQFRDQYLARISSQSTSIAVFAFLVLLWITGKVFFNLESLMNRIWAVKRDRNFFSRIQNFFLCMVIFPFAYLLALSLPRILRYSGQEELGHFFHRGLPGIIVFSSLIFIFRYFPNTAVRWRSAALGAAISSVGFAIANFFLGFYFVFGTTTAYGKAGILPIFAYFIYVYWMIFILGVEASLLFQSGRDYAIPRLPRTTLSQAVILEQVVKVLSERLQNQSGAISKSELQKMIPVESIELNVVLSFLSKKNMLVSLSKKSPHDESFYALSKIIDEAVLIDLIKDFLDLSSISQNFDVFHLITRLK